MPKRRFKRQWQPFASSPSDFKQAFGDRGQKLYDELKDILMYDYGAAGVAGQYEVPSHLAMDQYDMWFNENVHLLKVNSPVIEVGHDELKMYWSEGDQRWYELTYEGEEDEQ